MAKIGSMAVKTKNRGVFFVGGAMLLRLQTDKPLNLRFKAASRCQPIKNTRKERNAEFAPFLKAWGGRAPTG